MCWNTFVADAFVLSTYVVTTFYGAQLNSQFFISSFCESAQLTSRNIKLSNCLPFPRNYKFLLITWQAKLCDFNSLEKGIDYFSRNATRFDCINVIQRNEPFHDTAHSLYTNTEKYFIKCFN